jgi:hypothetical protein
VVVDGGGDLVGERTGVADAGGAPVADDVEAARLEVGEQARRRQVLGHHLGSRSERGLHPGLAGHAELTALWATSPAATITSGFEVFVQEVMAAITTSPSPSSKVDPS